MYIHTMSHVHTMCSGVLQTVMRLLDNCSLETDKVQEIQDDLNYYVDCNQVLYILYAPNPMWYCTLHMLQCTCSVGRALCLEYRVSWVRVPPEAAHFF